MLEAERVVRAGKRLVMFVIWGSVSSVKGEC